MGSSVINHHVSLSSEHFNSSDVAFERNEFQSAASLLPYPDKFACCRMSKHLRM